MGEVLEFIPREEFDSRANLSAFISHCRNDLTVFGSDLDWNGDRWVLDFKQRGKNHFHTIVWKNWDTSKSESGKLLQQPFLDFSRAYLRYRYALTRKTSTVGFITAFRALERVLVDEQGDVTVVGLDGDHFDAAAMLIRARYKSNKGYAFGGNLQEIARFLANKNICRNLGSWRNPIRKKSEQRSRVGKEFDKNREDKLPSPETMRLLFKARSDAVEDRDIVIVSTAILMCSNSCRVSEVLTLPVECEIERDGRYGLIWSPAKGAEPMVKWVYPEMVEITKEAIRRIKACSESARKVAKFYEDNPGELPFIDEYKHLIGKQWAELSEVACALRMTEKALDGEVSRPGIGQKIETEKTLINLKDLESSLSRHLPLGFPLLDLKADVMFSESLFVFPRHFFNAQKTTIHTQIERLTTGKLNFGLGGNKGHYASSIFYRLGYLNHYL